MKRPFLYIFIFYSLGIVFHNIFKVNISAINTMLLVSISISVSLYIVNLGINYLKYILLIIIFLMAIININRNTTKHILPKFYEKQVKLNAVVKECLSKEEGFEKYLIMVEKLQYKEKVYVVEEKTMLNIYKQTHVKVGDRIVIDAKINKPNRNTNPKLFNYRLYLQTKDIFATASSNANLVKIIDKDNLNIAKRTSKDFRNRTTHVLDNSLSQKNSSIIKSIILGDNSFLEQEEINKFRKLGLSHILAISGLHIGIIFGFIVYILDVLKVHRKASMIISIIVIWTYGYLVGYPPSVLRGSIMFSFLILASISYHRYDPINILSLSGFIMLMYRPLWLFSIGFQLSFLATFTILLFTPKIKQFIKIKNNSIKSTLSVIIAAQIGVLPVTIYYFNELQVLSILANLVVVPLVSMSLVLGFLILLTSIISIKVSYFIGIFVNIILSISNYIVDILSEFSDLNIVLHSPSFIEITVYYFFIFILLKITDITMLDRRVRRFFYVSFVVTMIITTFTNSFLRKTSVEFIDVGQGDSCLVRIDNKNILIDTGGNVFSSFSIGDNILLPYLQKTGVNNLDAVFITHFDADHAKGLLSLIGNIEIKNIFIGYKNIDNYLYKDIVKSSKEHNVPIRIISEGNTVKTSKNSYLQVLSPNKHETSYGDDNNNSLTFIFNIYNKRLLFTGDIESKIEQRIISKYKSQNIDILKVPHHGSKSSSTQEFITHFNPRYAVIQVGKNNFGHPDKDILKRYKNNNTEVYRNDNSGLVTVKLTKDDMSFSTYLKEKQTFSNFFIKNTYLIVVFTIYNGIITLLVLEYKRLRIEVID